MDEAVLTFRHFVKYVLGDEGHMSERSSSASSSTSAFKLMMTAQVQLLRRAPERKSEKKIVQYYH